MLANKIYLKANKIPNLYISANFYIVRTAILKPWMELHTGFYTYTIEFCALFPLKMKQNKNKGLYTTPGCFLETITD